MRLTKKQLEIMDALHNGGYIWGDNTKYLARSISWQDGVHRLKSEKLHLKTFLALNLNGLLRSEDGKWFAK